MGLPAAGVWPPFAENNTASLVHGAESPRAIAGKAEEIHETLVQHAPWLNSAVFLPQVNRYLQAAAREQLIHDHIMGLCTDVGARAVPQRLWESATACARLAGQLANELGLSPCGHAELKQLAAGAEVAEYNLADLITKGQEALDRRSAARNGSGPGNDTVGISNGSDGATGALCGSAEEERVGSADSRHSSEPTPHVDGRDA